MFLSTPLATAPIMPFGCWRGPRVVIPHSLCARAPATSPAARRGATRRPPHEVCGAESAAQADAEVGPARIICVCHPASGLYRIRPGGRRDFPEAREPGARPTDA